MSTRVANNDAIVTGAKRGSSTLSNHSFPDEPQAEHHPRRQRNHDEHQQRIQQHLKRHVERRSTADQELHDWDEQHQHDQVVDRHLHERVRKVAVGEMLQTNTIAVHGAAARMMQPAMYWSASCGLMKAEKTGRKKTHARAATENDFTIQFTTSSTIKPAGRRLTLRTAEKSTFIIIGVIISRIKTAIGALI